MESRVKRFIITISILAVLGGIIAAWVKIYPDWLWFNMVEYPSIYIKILKTKIFVGVIVGIAYLAILLTNLYIVYRLTPAHLSPAFMGGTEFTGGQTNTRKMVYGGLLLLAVLFSILMGYSATDRWEIYLRYTHAKELNFQAATPIIVEDNLDSSEITVSPLELAAKKIQVGDEISIHIEKNDPIIAQVAEVKQGGIRLNTPVQIEQGQKAYFKSLARDPIFDKDVAYYVFKMPMERYIIGTLFGILLLVTIFAVIIYFFHGLITGDTNQIRFQPPARVKAHLFTLVGLTLLFRAWNYRFVMYDLLYTSNDVVRGGGGYAAINARLPILWIMLVITVLCATVFIVSIFLRRNTVAFGAFVVFIIAGFLGQLYPQIIQRWRVEPRKQVLEADYINYNIKATLQAYGLAENKVLEEEYPLTEAISYEEITSQENAPVFNSIRLWDWRPLRRTFRQLQELRSQYDFYDVDIDRYIVDDEIRQVMLSGRELNISELPAEFRNDWFKETYVYTHGYGAVVSPVNEIDNGKPNMYIQGLPPIQYQEQWEHRFTETPGPRIYYGERTNRYVIVHPDRPEAKLLEFDFPIEGQQYAEYAYQGKGGVPLKSFWRKLVYMLKFDNEINFILPGEISSTSRILYERNIIRRVQKIAPFLQYESKDPYIILHEGRIVWMIDAYTVTHRYPYSVSMRDLGREKRPQAWGNYIRNSVKVVVDAYDGTADFYIMEREQDPIAECYRKIFPDLFKPFEEMPDELKAHIRYPIAMFHIQAQVYQDYHMKDPVTFYAAEDKWEIGKELYDHTDAQTRQIPTPQPRQPFGVQQQTVQSSGIKGQLVEPYYVVIRLPGQEKAEFMLMLPFTPRNKPNLTAWLAARCDLPQYGQLLVYRFPKGKQVAGPMQVENFISQEPEISQQISLWNTQGSRVLRGNLLILPMNDSLLYVEPIYIQSEDEKTAIPELRRVVIGYENEVVWGETLDEALREMFVKKLGLQTELTATTDVTLEATELPETATSLRGLIEQANSYYNNAQNAQRNGNWAEYGRNIRLLEQTLKQLQENAGQ
ncbi:MAG: UPF0182 family protein [Candidatus Poribacteria bacterium]|nr:UPF0182 family protein [Candidatus Poribacteria bacterium]